MKVAFRVDASLQMGSGHVMRCLSLASTLRDCGVDCQFICREHPGNLLELIRQQGFRASGLPLAGSGNSAHRSVSETPLAHAAWLGGSWQTDAEQTLAALQEEFVDWLVVDHYAIDSNWEQAVRLCCQHILAIDDLADRNHDCDLLLDQNLVAQMTGRYRNKVPSSCGHLVGPRFALLQPHYAALHTQTPPREGAIRTVLVYFGGADNANLTGKTIAAFLSLGHKDVQLDVVINPDGPHASVIEQQIQGLAQVRLHTRLPSLSHLMMRADIAIGASGATSWERCCLGLPALVVSLADNQKGIAEELQARGLINYLGHVSDVDEERLKLALGEVLDGKLVADWSLRCYAVVDGRGAQRVAGAMLLPQTRKLSARRANFDDEAVCIDLLAISSAAASCGIWDRSWLRDRESYLPIIVEGDFGTVVALVVFDLRNPTIDTTFAVDPFAQAKGLALQALATALRELRKTRSGVIQLSKCPTNIASDLRSGSDSNLLRPQSLSISVCSDAGSWINDSIPGPMLKWLAAGHRVSWAHDASDLVGGDVCFYLSYGRIVGPEIRSRYNNNLVVHASDLPKGRGWSPASWLILEGAERIPVTLLEAVEEVDAGRIYRQEWLELNGTELIEDWRALLADTTIRLAGDFIARYPDVLNDAKDQIGEPSSYLRRRPKDSEVDPTRPLVELFNQLRIADNDHYPVYFKHLNAEYYLRINRKI